MQLFLILLLAVAAIVVAPLLWIWSLNTLFPVLAIPYTFWTWLASFLLGGLVASRSYQSK
jgi:hypothetical protein